MAATYAWVVNDAATFADLVILVGSECATAMFFSRRFCRMNVLLKAEVYVVRRLFGGRNRWGRKQYLGEQARTAVRLPGNGSARMLAVQSQAAGVW
jgi:hypothetical protein